MANRPDVLKDWASNPTALITEPPSAYALEGMKHREFLVANYQNWILNNQAAWDTYLNSLPAGLFPASAYDGLEITEGAAPGVFSAAGGTFLHGSGVKVELAAQADFNLAAPASAPGAGTYRVDSVVARYNGATNVTTMHVIESPAAPLSTDLVLAIVRATGAVYTVDRIWRTARLGQPSHRITVGDGRHGNGNYALRLSGSIQEAIDLCSSLGGGVVDLSGDDRGLQTESIFLRSNVVLDGGAKTQLRFDPPLVGADKSGIWISGGLFFGGGTIVAASGTISDPTADFTDYGVGSILQIAAGPNAGYYRILDISTTTNPNDTATLVTRTYTAPALANEAGVSFAVYLSRTGLRNLELSQESADVAARLVSFFLAEDIEINNVRHANYNSGAITYTYAMFASLGVTRMRMTRSSCTSGFTNSFYTDVPATVTDGIFDANQMIGNFTLRGPSGIWGVNKITGAVTIPAGYQTWDLYAQDATLRDVRPRHVYQDDSEKIIQGTGNDCENYFDGTNLLQILPNGAQKIVDGDLYVSDYAGGGGAGDLICNANGAAAASTRGFLYLPTLAGIPVGVPVGHGSRVPMAMSQHYFWFYTDDGIATSWKGRAIKPVFVAAKADRAHPNLLDSTATRVQFDSVISDYSSIVTIGGAWVATVPRSSRYLITVEVAFAGLLDYVDILDNGTLLTRLIAGGFCRAVSGSIVRDITTGHSIYVEVYQSTGAPMPIDAVANISTRIEILEVY